MALRADVHPSTESLQALALGKLNDASSASLLSHLASCPACQKAAAAMSSDDFLKRLRDAHDRSGTPAPAKQLSGLSQSVPVPPGRPRRRPKCRRNWPTTRSTKSSANWAAAAWALSTWPGTSSWTAWKCSKSSTRPCWTVPAPLERFLREIRSAARLNHANVVAAYSAVQSGELLAFAMEYVEGEDLARLVQTQGPLPVAHACYYVQQAALGLQHAFEKDMVHRDIKPQNLILRARATGTSSRYSTSAWPR